MNFSASLDRPSKIISGLLCLILLAVVISVHNIVASCLAFLILAVSVAYSPRGYVLEGRSILVKRLAGTVRIALDDVREARHATPDDFRGCVRLRGSGGLFGYYGLFRTNKLHKCTWYVTDRSKCIVVIAHSKTMLFSPDDTDGFLTTVQAAAPQFGKTAVMPEAIVPGSPGRGKVIVVAVALAALALVAVATSYSPGPPRYTLTGESLTIHDRFYPVTLLASGVDIGGIRIVDLDRNTEWRPTRRTNGFANSHYQSGWFQTANGQKVRLYRAGGWRMVLLPPRGEGAPVLYQAADPETFVEQLRATWGGATRSAKSGKIDLPCAPRSPSRS